MGSYASRDSQTGLFTNSFSDADLLATVKSESPVQSKEIAARFDCTTRNARIRLNQLVTDGKVTVEQVGPTKLYYPI